MTNCFRHNHNLYKRINYHILNRINLLKSFKYSFCTETSILQDDDDDDTDIQQQLQSLQIEDTFEEKEFEEEQEPIDYEWEPEKRYQDFLKSYCTNNKLDDKKWSDIAIKLDSHAGNLQNWIQRVTNNNSDVNNLLNIQFAELTDENNNIQTQPQILLCRPNLCIDLYWPSTLGTIPALHSLILIDNKYIACIMKHLSITHLRGLIIGIINEHYETKYIINKFPNIDWLPISENIENINMDSIMNSENIIALGYRFKIPLINNCVMSSNGKQIIYENESDIDVCDVQNMDDIKLVQCNGCNKQSYYINYKKRQKTLQENELENECDDDIVLHKVFPSGIKKIDLMNPLVKHGLNVVIIPKGYDSDIFKQLGMDWCMEKDNHVVYMDIFDDDMDAINLKNEIQDKCGEYNGKFTVIAGKKKESDWFKLQAAINAATLSKNDENASDTLVIYPNCNVINKCMNNLQRDVCGGLSKLKFENNDEIGHRPYDWIQQRSKRNKPQSTIEFYLNYGIEPTLNGSTYIIGLQMNYEEIRDIRINPSAYFPCSDSVIIFDENNKIDITHSSSKILSEIKYTNLSENNIKVLNALRRLYSDYQLLSQIDNNNSSNIDSVLLWNDIFNDNEIDNYEYTQYENTLDYIYCLLRNKYDHNGNLLLDINCLDNDNINVISETFYDYNPLVSILKNNNDDLLQKLNEFYEASILMDVYDDNPEIVIKSRWDHGGFLKSAKLNMGIELFSDNRLRYGIGIGQYCVLFINEKPVKVPNKYGYEKKKKKQNENENSLQIDVENIDYESENENDNEDEIINVFEKLSSKIDAFDEFGLNIARFEKGKAGQRYDFLHMAGELKKDIYDICIFIFGYNMDTKQPFMVQKRVGPDQLPIQSKTKKKKKKKALVIENENENDIEQIHENVINPMDRKEFVLVLDNAKQEELELLD